MGSRKSEGIRPKLDPQTETVQSTVHVKGPLWNGPGKQADPGGRSRPQEERSGKTGSSRRETENRARHESQDHTDVKVRNQCLLKPEFSQHHSNETGTRGNPPSHPPSRSRKMRIHLKAPGTLGSSQAVSSSQGKTRQPRRESSHHRGQLETQPSLELDDSVPEPEGPPEIEDSEESPKSRRTKTKHAPRSTPRSPGSTTKPTGEPRRATQGEHEPRAPMQHDSTTESLQAKIRLEER